MVLVDTSAWVEFLRGTGSSAHEAVRRLIEQESPILTTDIVIMELLAGARGESRGSELRRFILGFSHTPVRGLADYEAAAALYRDCRRRGYTPSSLADCLVASVAIREGCRVLHHNRDYVGIAECSDLRLFQS